MTADCTLPTSPVTSTVTYPPPISCTRTTSTSAAFSMASAASITPVEPRASTIPRARTPLTSPPPFEGRTTPRSEWGRGITCTARTSPTFEAACAPASTADFTAATSPPQNTVAMPEPTRSQPRSSTLAAFEIASPPAITPVNPTVSNMPRASLMSLLPALGKRHRCEPGRPAR